MRYTVSALGLAVTLVVQGAEVPASIKQQLELVMSARVKQGAAPDITAYSAVASSFNEALLALEDAPRVPNEDDEATLEAKFMRIAHDRKRRPEVYSEIISNYADVKAALQKPGAQGRHAILSPSPERQHCTERYRLVWEYMVLAPQMNYLELYDQRALEALARIKSDKSLLTLSRRFELSLNTSEEMESYHRSQLELVTDVLFSFESEKALDTILSCLSEWKRVQASWPKRPDTPDPDWDLCKWLANALSSKDGVPLRRPWKRILAAYSNRVPELSWVERESFELLQSAAHPD